MSAGAIRNAGAHAGQRQDVSCSTERRALPRDRVAQLRRRQFCFLPAAISTRNKAPLNLLGAVEPLLGSARKPPSSRRPIALAGSTNHHTRPPRGPSLRGRRHRVVRAIEKYEEELGMRARVHPHGRRQWVRHVRGVEENPSLVVAASISAVVTTAESGNYDLSGNLTALLRYRETGTLIDNLCVAGRRDRGDRRLWVRAPGGHPKLPHLWPGQTPPPPVAGRGDSIGLTRASQLARR